MLILALTTTCSRQIYARNIYTIIRYEKKNEEKNRALAEKEHCPIAMTELMF